MAARHHKSKAHRKEHITMHDREMDRENLMHARKAREKAGMHAGMERYERRPMINHEADRFNDEMHHDRDMEKSMYRKGLTQGEMYAGMEPRRRQELEDAGMIHENHNAIANMPQQWFIKPYPKTGPYNPEVLDDTISGVDGQMDYDNEKRREHFYPKKV